MRIAVLLTTPGGRDADNFDELPDRPHPSKQHVAVRARTPGRLTVLPCDRLDSEALLGVAAQQTARPQDHRRQRIGDAGATASSARICPPSSDTPERHRLARRRSRPISPNTSDAVDCGPAPAASAARTPIRGNSCRTSGVSHARRSTGRGRFGGSPAKVAPRGELPTNRQPWSARIRRSPVPRAPVPLRPSGARPPPSRGIASARPSNAKHRRQRPG